MILVLHEKKQTFRPFLWGNMVVMEMRKWGSPAALMLVVILLANNSSIPQSVDLDFVELFTGQGCVSLAMRASGFVGTSHDIDYSKHMDLCSRSGFLFLDCKNKQLLSC